MKVSQILLKSTLVLTLVCSIAYYGVETRYLEASSHREAPMIAEDPIADNTDLYAFRSPDNPNTVTIIANYIGLELPQGGPNYATFGENIRYEIHVKNKAGNNYDDITYRFTFRKKNEDPTTFFNIRLGKQNLKTTYTLERYADNCWKTIINNGVVPPPNIGPRSIDNATLGLGKSYEQLMQEAITTASTGEKVYCGPSDDPFFVDLGGIFDLGQTRAGMGARDGVGCYNVHAIAIQVPISTLQKEHKSVSQAKNILDGDYVIGVWASSSRPRISSLSYGGAKPKLGGPWVQVSRLGMPLTNEAVIPIGQKDRWNAFTPYTDEASFEKYFNNPELGLYMDDRLFGGAVPALSALRIQTKSQTVLGNVDFGNGKDGLFVIKGHPATVGTALDNNIFGNYLLRKGEPRSVDLLPIFYTGVPNLAPYQLATGKTDGNPLSAGKPFINNFLPTFGDMLRLNMATPVTSRNDSKFSSEGIIAAAVLGLTDPAYNTTKDLQFIPNMDGFPNGRRLEDDVTRIELQAVSGAALAAVGLWYDDRPLGSSPLSTDLLDVLTYTTGVETNDRMFQMSFPYVATPHRGTGECGGVPAGTLTGGNTADLKKPMTDPRSEFNTPNLGFNSPKAMMKAGQNPFRAETMLSYHLPEDGHVSVIIYDMSGKAVKVLEDQDLPAGNYDLKWRPENATTGMYIARILVDGEQVQALKLNYSK
jgi:Domain of unknown function (DUF4331)